MKALNMNYLERAKSKMGMPSLRQVLLLLVLSVSVVMSGVLMYERVFSLSSQHFSLQVQAQSTTSTPLTCTCKSFEALMTQDGRLISLQGAVLTSNQYFQTAAECETALKRDTQLCQNLGIPILTDCSQTCWDDVQGACACPQGCKVKGTTRSGSNCSIPKPEGARQPLADGSCLTHVEDKCASGSAYADDTCPTFNTIGAVSNGPGRCGTITEIKDGYCVPTVSYNVTPPCSDTNPCRVPACASRQAYKSKACDGGIMSGFMCGAPVDTDAILDTKVPDGTCVQSAKDCISGIIYTDLSCRKTPEDVPWRCGDGTQIFDGNCKVANGACVSGNEYSSPDCTEWPMTGKKCGIKSCPDDSRQVRDDPNLWCNCDRADGHGIVGFSSSKLPEECRVCSTLREGCLGCLSRSECEKFGDVCVSSTKPGRGSCYEPVKSTTDEKAAIEANVNLVTAKNACEAKSQVWLTKGPKKNTCCDTATQYCYESEIVSRYRIM